MTIPAFFDFVRNKSTGVGENGVSVELIRQSDNGVVGTTSTAGAGNQAGSFAFSEAAYDYFGPTRVVATDGEGKVHVHTSQSVGQIGPWRATDFGRAMRIMGEGVVSGVDGALAVSANGADMILAVAAGMAFAGPSVGLIYTWPAVRNVTVPANASGSTRFDRLVLRFYPMGLAEQGRIDLVYLQGTPGAGVPPAITQNLATYWEVKLAKIEVGNGVTAIAANKVTDERTYSVGPMLDSSVATVKLADSSVTIAKLDDGIVPVLIAPGGQTSADTTSTTNVGAGNTVSSLTVAVVLPGSAPDQWTFYAVGSLEMKHSADNQVLLTINIDGNESGGRNPTCPSTAYKTVHEKHSVSGIAGAQTVNVRLRYCGTDAGTTSAQNPNLLVIARRTS